MKFIELYNKYLEYKKLKLKDQSIRTIKSRFDMHILPFFKNYKISDIDVEVYIKWQNQIEHNGYKIHGLYLESKIRYRLQQLLEKKINIVR